jgi:serine/threonine protein kinase
MVHTPSGQLQYQIIDIDEISIDRPIGSGSFGSVFAAMWQETPVAVKMLIDGRAAPDVAVQDGTIAADLQKEAGLMASLRHPNIVQFLGVCIFPPAIVTEWCARGSLTDVLKAGKDSTTAAADLTWQRRLGMALDAAKGMTHLHGHKPAAIIHRDLKSPNLLVGQDWTVKIADFNLSKLVQEHTSTASMSTAGGPLNPRWLAPEVLSGETATTASDVYSFGVVMWELLTWEVPYTGWTNVFAINAAIIRGDRLAVPLFNQLPGIGATGRAPGIQEYIALMQQCWAADPSSKAFL